LRNLITQGILKIGEKLSFKDEAGNLDSEGNILYCGEKFTSLSNWANHVAHKRGASTKTLYNGWAVVTARDQPLTYFRKCCNTKLSVAVDDAELEEDQSIIKKQRSPKSTRKYKKRSKTSDDSEEDDDDVDDLWNDIEDCFIYKQEKRSTLVKTEIINSVTPASDIVLLAIGINDPAVRDKINQFTAKFSVSISRKFDTNVTHVIFNDDNHTTKLQTLNYDLFGAILKGCWIVTTEWIKLSLTLGKIQNENLFEVPHYNMGRQQRELRLGGLFKNNIFHLHGDFYTPTKVDLQNLIQIGDGKVINICKQSQGEYPEDNETEDKENDKDNGDTYNKRVIVSKDTKLSAATLDIYRESGITPISINWITDCITEYKILSPSAYE